jgi:hypothetical protein
VGVVLNWVHYGKYCCILSARRGKAVESKVRGCCTEMIPEASKVSKREDKGKKERENENIQIKRRGLQC